MELLRFKFGQKYLPFDFETCNLNLVSEKIQYPWQLGWNLAQKNKQMDFFENHEDWIHWDNLIPTMREWGKGAALVTGFQEYVYSAKAKPAEPIFNNFNKYFLDPSYLLVSANGQNFDLYLYKIYATLLGKSVNWKNICNRHIDVMVIEKADFLKRRIPPVNTNEFAELSFQMAGFKQKGLKTNLAHLCRKYGVDYDETRHHVEASYDTEITLKVFEKQMGLIDIFI